jgi:hypothetical protein
MQSRNYKLWQLATIAILLLSLGWFGHMQAQERVCGPFGGDVVTAWLVCSWEQTNERVDALETRITALETSQLTQAQIQGLAWDKANDRVSLFQQQSTAYTDKWFYDEVYKRFRVHVCRSGIPHNERLSCVGVTP